MNHDPVMGINIHRVTGSQIELRFLAYSSIV
jgi:hypothetical protein